MDHRSRFTAHVCPLPEKNGRPDPPLTLADRHSPYLLLLPTAHSSPSNILLTCESAVARLSRAKNCRPEYPAGTQTFTESTAPSSTFAPVECLGGRLYSTAADSRIYCLSLQCARKRLRRRPNLLLLDRHSVNLLLVAVYSAPANVCPAAADSRISICC